MGGGHEANGTMEIYNSYCESSDAHYYGEKIDVPAAYNWCLVHHSGADVILFAGVAVVVACLWQGKFNTLLTLLSGFLLQCILFNIDVMDYLSSGVAWWLGIQPYELFFYIFLPPLLLDAGLRIDIFLFKKVLCQVLVLAFGVVILGTGMLIPIMLYGLNLQSYGWKWQHVALFGSMVASTDAVAIISVMKACGGPRRLRVMLEGEALLNDASSITLFTIFMGLVDNLAHAFDPEEHQVTNVMADVVFQTLYLAGGGLLVGVAFGVVMHAVMQWLARIGAPRDAEIALTLAAGYLSFYVANSPLKVSGVISVAVFSLYGAASSKWDASLKLELGGAFETFWDTLAYIVNGIVFFYSGVAIANFVLRSTDHITESGAPLEYAYIVAMMVPIWLAVFFNRFLFLVVFQPMYWLCSTSLSLRETAFLTFAGLRGSVSLIMAQAVVTELSSQQTSDLVLKSEIVLFAAGFVLLTLLIQAPLLGRVLKRLKLIVSSRERLEMRKRAVNKLSTATQKAIHELKTDKDEFMRGVNWHSVQHVVNHRKKYKEFLDPLGTQDASPKEPFNWKNLLSWSWIKGKAQHSHDHDHDADRVAKVVEGRTHSEVHSTIHARTSKKGLRIKVANEMELPTLDEEAGQELLETGQELLKTGQELMGEKECIGEVRGTPQTAAKQGRSTGTVETMPMGGSSSSSSNDNNDDDDDDDDDDDVSGDDEDDIEGDVPFFIEEDGSVDLQEVMHDMGDSTVSLKQQTWDETCLDEEEHNAQLADLRIRLTSSMKRYFHNKRMEGLLGNKSQRMLSNACDLQIDDPSKPIGMWKGLEREVVGYVVVRVMSKLLILVRKAHLSLRRWKWSWFKRPLQWVLRRMARFFMKVLARRMTMACEVAIEYEMALLHNPLVHWLQDSHLSSVLLAEVEKEVQQVEQFILHRELEAPDRFNAIQTYRGTLAVLRRQADCVEHMCHVGMVDEGEKELIMKPILIAEMKLTGRGPTSKPPSLKDVLRSLPFLRHMPSEVISTLLTEGELIEYPATEVICEFDDNANMYVVVSGVVAAVYEAVGTEATTKEYFLASGGVFGLYNAISGETVPGSGRAVAKGRAMGTGPVVYVCKKAAFDHIRLRAAEGDEVYGQLVHDMYRMSALYCTARLHSLLLPQITTLLMEMTNKARAHAPSDVDSDAEAAARQRLAALFEGAEEEGDDKPTKPSVDVGAELLESDEDQEAYDDATQQYVGAPAHGEELNDQHLRQACNKQAREIYNNLKPLLTSSVLLELFPSQTYLQCTTTVVMKGALTSTDPLLNSVQGPGLSKDADGTMHFRAPFVLPWVWDAAPPLTAPKSIKFQADPRSGATLLYCTASSGADSEAAGSTGTVSLGQGLPLGADLRSMLRTITSKGSASGSPPQEPVASVLMMRGEPGMQTSHHQLVRPSVLKRLRLNNADVDGRQS